MNSPDANSPIATLRQLKEMLDAGTLTPQEFEALKQKLIFGAESVAPVVPVASEPMPTTPTPAYVAPVEAIEPVAPEVSAPPSETPDWLAAAAPALVDHHTTPESEPAYEEGLEKRNPLNLVFAIGGALVFLAVVLYLTLGNRATTDEHLTSTTQTAADSARVTPEVGPQAQQLTLPPASPETIRVAPVVPTAVAPAASKFSSDSAATPAATNPAVTPAKPAAKPAPTTTVATDSAI